jgi:hypothetical protein
MFRKHRAVLLMICLLWICGPLEAETGGRIVLPTGQLKPRNGLKLAIDYRWLDGTGYRPVRVELINWPPGPSKANRTICIVLRPSTYSYRSDEQQVTQYLELPQGAARARATISVPQLEIWRQLAIFVYEDGRLCEDLCRNAQITTSWRTWSEANPAILIIDTDAPSFEERRKWLGRGPTSGQAELGGLPDLRYLPEFFPASTTDDPTESEPEGLLDGLNPLEQLQRLPKVALLPPSELPDRWIDYTCCDMVFISFADLKVLARQHPRRWQAIRQWVRSGPVLCVYDMDLSQQSLDELSLLLDLPVAAVAERAAPSTHWRRPNDITADTSVRALQNAVEYYEQVRRDYSPPLLNSGAAVDRDAESSADEEGERKEASQRPELDPFLFRRVALGRVAAIRTAAPFQSGEYGMPWLLNELDSEQWMWYQRHGMSMHRRNKFYWDWMIPGVGSPPVGCYLLLISVFVVVIGPLNYFLLRRKKRLYMLLVTVPLGAGMVTMALLSYALFTDGLAVRTRIRSYTQVDQRTGIAQSWSRQTYYAGLAPSGGLTYPGDTVVYPIDQYPSRGNRRRTTRQLDWDGDQKLTAGYLGSRSAAQLLVIRSATTERGLDIAPGDGEDAAPLVTNRLDTRIIELFLTGRGGRHYHASNLQPGERLRPEPVTVTTAISRLRALIDTAAPAFPPGYDPESFSLRRGFGGYYQVGWTDIDQSLEPPDFGPGILERNIRMCREGDGVGWLPGGYVAITETSPETPCGYAASREEASFHMIVGQW